MNYCKDCTHFYGDGKCRVNKKGYTAALAADLPCWEAKTEPAVVKLEQPGMKVCKKCGQVLPLEAFPYHPKSKDGHTATCSMCHAESQRAGQARARKKAAPEKKEEPQPEEPAQLFVPKEHVERVKFLASLNDLELAEELRRRGWSGTLTQNITI